MSNSVANALKAMQKPELSSTIEFIQNVNRFFDFLNVSKRFQSQRTRNDDLEPYCSVDDPRLKWLKDGFLKFLKDRASEGEQIPDLSKTERGRLCLSKATLTGCHITVHSFIEICQKLLKIEGVEYILSDKFNQDPIEEFFGKQRSAGGHHDIPSLEQFGHHFMRNVFAGNRAASSKRGNVRPQADVDVDTEEEILPKRPRPSKK
ncbi:hypothetical protein HOLleu_01252 [Holothuria leucospilota]|uniref:Uncharacterized protein n=1 Tax=Holothuria leucospilota TaxID=206669 RepID=A0A9Q1CPP6_HOLLE|nr:hypothetical protein HOLleu_01252 [Holothuria leucospilota]